MDAVCMVEVVVLVLTKNNLGFLATSSHSLKHSDQSWQSITEKERFREVYFSKRRFSQWSHEYETLLVADLLQRIMGPESHMCPKSRRLWAHINNPKPSLPKADLALPYLSFRFPWYFERIRFIWRALREMSDQFLNARQNDVRSIALKEPIKEVDRERRISR